MQIYFITSRQLLYTIGINPNIYRQIPWIYHGNYSGGNYLPTKKMVCLLNVFAYTPSEVQIKKKLLDIVYNKKVSLLNVFFYVPSDVKLVKKTLNIVYKKMVFS